MSSQRQIEFIVGIFVLMGLLAFGYLAVKMGDVGLFKTDTFTVKARFQSISGLKVGAAVEMAGVKVGKVSSIEFDRDNYEAIVEFTVPNGVQIQEDSIASIRTAGIIGDKFVKLTPGGLEEYIEPGGEITETESSINLEELVSKYIFESK